MSRTKAQNQHFDGVAQLGCLKCLEIGYETPGVEIHHCGTGAGGRRDDMKVAGLCPHHHRWLKDSIDKAGKARTEIETRWLDYVAEHCPCFTCKAERTRIENLPRRIQRKRTKGWKMPPGTIYVGRPGKWGNPYYAGLFKEYTAEQQTADFRRWIEGDLGAERWAGKPPSHEDIRQALKGKDLACWCPPGKPCHADVLLEIAND